MINSILNNKIFSKLRHPPGINFWILWLHADSVKCRHHMRALVAVPHGKSKFLRGSYYIAQYIAWIIFFAWQHSWRAIRYLAKKEKKRNAHVLSMSYLRMMLNYIWIYHIPLPSILRYQLLERPEQVLDHIYIHEIPKWQHALSNTIGRQESRLLTDKDYFSKKCERQQIAAIKTLGVIAIGEIDAKLSWIFQQEQSIFIKPPSANRSEDCFHLFIKDGRVVLRAMNRQEEYIDRNQIISHLTAANKKHPLITQPLLTNMAIWDDLSPSDELITMRIITEYYLQEVVVISGVIEIPKEDGGRYYDVIPINPINGMIHDRYFKHIQESIDEHQQALLTKLAGTTVPLWTDLVCDLHKAHQLCPNIHLVGWDAAITPDGPVIIEGNFGWGTHSFTLNELAIKKLKDIII